MTTLKCDLCDHVAEGETFEGWVKALMPHYMKDHADVMMDPNKTEEDKNKWMADNRIRFDS